MEHDLPDGIVPIGEVVNLVIEKIDDPDFTDSARILEKQRDEALDKTTDLAEMEKIEANYRHAMGALLDWFEFDRVRYTINPDA